MRNDRFPFRFFAFYFLFYAAQAMYSSYMNLFLRGRGFSMTQIGGIVSVSTLALLLVQPVWGLASDKARNKNAVMLALMAVSAGIALLFPQVRSPWLLAGLVCLNAAFFNPIAPLQDNLTLEHLAGTRWDFGQIRMGGTLGYALTTLVVGLFLRDAYVRIFYIVFVFLLASLVTARKLPAVHGHRHGGDRAPVRILLRDPALLCLLFFNLAYSLGASFFYNFYPIHFTTVGGNSGLVGTLLFVCAMAEVPFFFFAGRIVKRFGIYATLLVAGLATSLRWFLLFMLTSPALIIAANLLHGVGFATISYCMATYINANAPRELRATAQSLLSLVTAVFARIVFGYVGGLASDRFGVENMMLFSCLVMLAATAVFAVWFRQVRHGHTLAGTPEA